jgi:hypothetical protein
MRTPTTASAAGLFSFAHRPLQLVIPLVRIALSCKEDTLDCLARADGQQNDCRLRVSKNIQALFVPTVRLTSKEGKADITAWNSICV